MNKNMQIGSRNLCDANFNDFIEKLIRARNERSGKSLAIINDNRRHLFLLRTKRTAKG